MRHLTSTSLSVLWLTCSLGSSLVFAQKPADPAKTAPYLALGDSLAFGYRPDVPVALANYVGYPQIVSDAMNLNVANASCFGETSSHALDLAVRISRAPRGCSMTGFASLKPTRESAM